MEKRKKSTYDKLLENKRGRIVFGIFNAVWGGILFYIFWGLFFSKPEIPVLDKALFIIFFVLLLAINLSLAIQGKEGFGYKLSNGLLFRRKPKEEPKSKGTPRRVKKSGTGASARKKTKHKSRK